MQTDPLEVITSFGRREDFEEGFFFGTEGPCAFATRALLIDVASTVLVCLFRQGIGCSIIKH